MSSPFPPLLQPPQKATGVLRRRDLQQCRPSIDCRCLAPAVI
ncbi:hypothetical protein E2C01_100963 [Portunus trituberculatus]|uniref:Uncharacterized protein n=1 Tax=Portunus trituberculatus TaxID=210409 RepID=A0A5B7K4H0_PORTR|nr:hypothetical protein [Portunus trituberculatus]